MKKEILWLAFLTVVSMAGCGSKNQPITQKITFSDLTQKNWLMPNSSKLLLSIYDFKIIEDQCKSLPSGVATQTYDIIPKSSGITTHQDSINLVQSWLELNKTEIGFLHERMQRYLDNCFTIKTCASEKQLEFLNGTLQYSIEFCDHTIQSAQTIIDFQQKKLEQGSK